MIYFSSDYHFFHDRPFIWQVRGFNSVEEMNIAILQNHNSIIKPEDDVYLLGDLLLGGNAKLEEELALIAQLNGRLHLVRGNHDTNTRWDAYKSLPNVVEAQNAIYLNYRKYHFYLSHFPTFTANLEKESLHQCTINLYGHTHQKDNFFEGHSYMYHVGVDSHNCIPILIDNAIKDMNNEVNKCKSVL